MKHKDPIWLDKPMDFAQNRIDSRRYILLPKIAAIIAEFQAKSILDYGCGEGYLAENIENKQIDFHLYDISNVMLEIANQNISSKGFESYKILKTRSEIVSRKYDVVVSSLVLMTIGDDDEYLQVLRDLKNARTEDGFIIIGITHPCFRQSLFSTHHTEFSLGEPFNYFKNNEPFEVYLRSSKSETTIQFKDFHHNLTYVFSKLKEAGITVDEIIELEDRSIENSYYNLSFPPYLILKCK